MEVQLPAGRNRITKSKNHNLWKLFDGLALHQEAGVVTNHHPLQIGWHLDSSSTIHILHKAWCYWPCARTVGISVKMLFTVHAHGPSYGDCYLPCARTVPYRDCYVPCAYAHGHNCPRNLFTVRTPIVEVNEITYRAWSNVAIKNY